MSVSESPLFGSVEILRLYPTWQTRRHNRFSDPRATANRASDWGGSAVALGTYTDADGRTWHRSRRTETGAARFKELRVTDGVLSGGLSYRIKFTARANRTLSLIPSLRPDATKTADRTDAAAISVGTVEKRFSITLKMAGTPGDLAGLALVETVSPVGAILDVTDVTWELSTSSGTDYFDGDSMPNGFVTRTRWLGTPNASRSVLEVRGTEHIRRARSVTFRRGAARSALGLKTDVGILSFELIDSQDPMRGGVFQPGDEIVCISLDRDENMSQLFTGRVTDVAGTYPLNKATGTMRAITTVTVADAVKVHGETPRYGVSIPAGFETYEARISRLSSSALAPVEAPTEGTPREVYVF